MRLSPHIKLTHPPSCLSNLVIYKDWIVISDLEAEHRYIDRNCASRMDGQILDAQTGGEERRRLPGIRVRTAWISSLRVSPCQVVDGYTVVKSEGNFHHVRYPSSIRM